MDQNLGIIGVAKQRWSRMGIFTQRHTRSTSGKGLLGANPSYYDNDEPSEKRRRRPSLLRRFIDGHPVLIRRALISFVIFWFIFSVQPAYLYYFHHVQSLVVEDQLAEASVPDLPKSEFPRPSVHDDTDGFSTFTKTANCSINSLDLHTPFEPLCKGRAKLLEEMSSGGRHGFDAPYSLRTCDMRWYRSEEICTILSRFRGIYVIGDSLMRNLAIGLHVLMRKDLYNGGRSGWTSDPEGVDCHCRQPFQEKDCIWHAAVSTGMVYQNDPESLYCGYEDHAKIEYNAVTAHPIAADQIDALVNKVIEADTLADPETLAKPMAFVYGHGLWNNLEAEDTFKWWLQLDEILHEQTSYLFKEEAPVLPRLFITPSAGSPKKPEVFWAKQGNLAMARFEKEVGGWMRERKVDHLGIFNLTVQSTSPDGTHAGMHVNLVKAMMVLNWLDSFKGSGDEKTEL